MNGLVTMWIAYFCLATTVHSVQAADIYRGKMTMHDSLNADADPLYPKYHVAPPVGWMNDPHPIFFKGTYHIFYQYSRRPDDPYGGPHSWGHAMSKDLIHWTQMPVAITPADHGIASDQHIWSGCLVDNNGVGTAIYTINNIDIWTATSSDVDLATFRKYPGNPIIKGPVPGLEMVGEMRDPYVWKEPDGWYLIVGSGLKSFTGPLIPLYHSTDLINWQYLHPLYEGSGDGGFCECPGFFPLGDMYCLTISNNATYMTGRYENHRFIPGHRGRLDYGKVYVPQTILDDKGRRIMWGWIQDGREREAQKRAGWAGMQTLPRVVSLRPDGMLEFKPAKELESLRRDHRSFGKIKLADNTTHILEEVQGAQLEIAAEFEQVRTGAVGLALISGPDKTEILYDATAKTVRCGSIAPIELAAGEPLKLRVFVDGSVVEVFANDRVCITERFYPEKPELLQVALISHGTVATASKVDVWKMSSIWTIESEPQNGEVSTAKQWSKERAWNWYNSRTWINGCNYLPSYAGNSTEFWQDDTFNPEMIDKELALAEMVGYNSVRVLMQYLVWENNPESYKKHFEQFLEIAARHGISVMPQFFDDCAFGKQPDLWKRHNPYLGIQDDPIPGVFFPNWAPSPGHSRVTDLSAWPRLKPGTPEPAIPFTDIFKDIKGTPYYPEEIEAIKKVSFKK